ncbi:DsbA family protein [Actinomadura atramentaria]|uniref:DsbA family protein n=1 Tax=Actinomadura atramentaria TaxID=1990 RepID=UPI00035F95AD|nr:thioredoxin domain-containing protein [Actinomadura atramentaria]
MGGRDGRPGRGTARDRLAADRERARVRRRRRRGLTVLLLAVVVLAVAAVVVAVVIGNRADKEPEAYHGPVAPVARQDDGSTVMAEKGVTKPVLEIFEDFQCPVCRSVEETSGPTIKRLAAERRVRVVYRPFQLFQGARLEPLSSNSRRAANAALCAPADHWLAYHDALYANQPREGTDGFSPDDLVKWGREAGITDAAFEGCVRNLGQAAKLEQMTAYAQQHGVEATPTVLLDGAQVGVGTLRDPDALAKAIGERPRA